MRSPRTILAAAFAALAPGAAAQPAFERIEQGVADVDLLRRSLRVSPWAEMRRPEDFEAVYRLSGTDALTSGDGMFYRFDGALTAAFPRSVYNQSPGGGLVPVIPAGTIFYIGLPPALTAPVPGPREPAYNRLDLSIPSALDPRPPAPALPRPDSPVQRSIWTSEAYRQARLHALINRAAGAPAAR